MKQKKLMNNKGFTLIELLVSFVILSIFLGVVGSALQNSFSQNTRADNKLNSIYLAKNTLEYYKNQSFEFTQSQLDKRECQDPETGAKMGIEVVPDNIMTLPENEKEKLKNYQVCVEFTQPSNEKLIDKLIKIKIRVWTTVNGKLTKYENIEGYKRNETQ
ncbi:type II secretion system protein [Peribacillus glennii]|uniref:Type II secretion system protein n=1 Tax=Peribacillus glennii TaxID=2303991 RepID=A0A372LHV1_9BACI|nr:type II secretion system protein [Peribacillus glennii]RFU65885.1 type II secretion system protein [Peribacillus glennii]